MQDEDIPKKLILYIDDEPKNLVSFKSVFRRHYDIYLATSAMEGSVIMEQNPIQLVITDQRMPKVTGVEFLEQIAGQYPDVMRIILTGYSDMEAIVAAINKGRVHQYITKPWKSEDLKVSIDSALEINRLKTQNRSLMDELQKTNYELDRFVYSAAHDLRSPIATLLGLINLSKTENNLDIVKDYLNLKEITVKRLDEFIQDIVNYSSNMRLEIEKNEIDFKEMTQKVLNSFSFYKNADKVAQSINVLQEGSFICDRKRLEVIFNNIIGNALRYSRDYETSYLKISIKADSQQAIIQFTDNGEGIETEHIEKIFNMFYRANSKAGVGSGLGLFIAREIAQKLGGDVGVQSKYNVGSVFTVIIPNFLEI